MTIDVVVKLSVVPLGVPLPLLLYRKGGRDYKEVNRVSYNMISIKILSLYIYFTDIIIYVLGNTS
jgi:hypothetical protein